MTSGPKVQFADFGAVLAFWEQQVQYFDTDSLKQRHCYSHWKSYTLKQNNLDRKGLNHLTIVPNLKHSVCLKIYSSR